MQSSVFEIMKCVALQSSAGASWSTQINSEMMMMQMENLSDPHWLSSKPKGRKKQWFPSTEWRPRSDVSRNSYLTLPCATDARGLQFKQPLGPRQNSRLVIFDENKASETEPQEPRFEIWTAPPTARAKENEQKPEKWTNVKVRVLRGVLMFVSGGWYLTDQHSSWAQC